MKYRIGRIRSNNKIYKWKIHYRILIIFNNNNSLNKNKKRNFISKIVRIKISKIMKM